MDCSLGMKMDRWIAAWAQRGIECTQKLTQEEKNATVKEMGNLKLFAVSKEKVMNCSLCMKRDQRYPAGDPKRNTAIRR